jgi:hypothetical protein
MRERALAGAVAAAFVLRDGLQRARDVRTRRRMARRGRAVFRRTCGTR